YETTGYGCGLEVNRVFRKASGFCQGNGDGGAAARLFSQDRWSPARISSIADKSYGTGGGAATARCCCGRRCYTTPSKRARAESTEGYSCFTAARAPDG